MEKSAERRSIVLVPLPLQGHITPLMQLGKALNLKGFSITVALGQGEFNQVSSSWQHFSGFQFVTIPESLPVSQLERFGPVEFMMKLNKTSEASFKNCIARLLLEQGNDIACIIYDDLMYFSEAAAKDFNIPSIIFRTTSATHYVSCCVLSKLDAEKFLIDMEGIPKTSLLTTLDLALLLNRPFLADPKMQDKVVENLRPLSYKDLPTSGFEPLDRFLELCREVVNKRTASAVIMNTVSCLESSSLSWLQQEIDIPVYPLGPLHITASAPSSLLEEDNSCIEWLNKQKERSVIYISLGSIAHMNTKEVLEMALGLCNSNQPFLWVTRPGSILGSNGEESFPEEVREMISERGYIVKWAPQIQVLAHPAVGGFWSHCGWNSTLESIGEGVPIICRPFNGEQKLNAMYIESVWSVGFQLEGELERGGVEKAVKRLIMDEEGVGMRERALVLKEKLKASVKSGGFSYNALDELVKNLKTE